MTEQQSISIVYEAKSEMAIATAEMRNTTTHKNEEFVMPKRKGDRLRLHHRTIIVYFGDIDSTQQSFKCRFECWVTRELSNKEIEKYKKNPIEFEPNSICNVFPVGCAEVIERDLMEFNNFKTFRVMEDNTNFNTFIIERCWLITCIFVETLELENFPFDVQHFEMLIQVKYTYSSDYQYNKCFNIYTLKIT